MVRKKLATVIAALVGTLQAGFVSALGLGELSLQSALNQPLVAEIDILNTGDLDASQVLVGLAGAQEFQNAGVSRDFFLTNIQFDVELDGDGGGVIKVTSQQPVVEPYLNFLVETRWPSGRLLREYTVLLDLPVFSEGQARPVEAARASAPPVRRAPPAVPPPVSDPEPALITPRQSVGNSDARFGGDLEPGGEYRVQNDDTLWVIAAKALPSNNVTVQQTMVGIQRLNPDAFARGNINRLKAGSVLRLPTEDDVIDVSASDAIEEVANQNRAWRSGDDQLVADRRAQLDATSRRSTLDDRTRAPDRLSIAAAGSNQSDQMGDGEGMGSGTQALRDQLMQSQEMLEKSNREKDELQSRVDDVEAKLATLQRLLQLKDNQLAAMQNAQSAAGGGDVQPEPPPEELELLQPLEQPADQEPQNVADADMPMEQPGALDDTGDLQSSEQGLIAKVLGNPLYLGGAGLLVLAAVAVAIIRRRRNEEEDEFDLDDDLDELSDASFDDGGLLGPDDTDGGPVLSFDDEPEPVANVTDQLAAELEQEIAADNAAEEAAAQAFAEPEEQVQQETGDAIAESDIYVAYGRYQQAVDLLRSAIEQEPDRSDLQVKLLEVYIETRDKPAFQQQYMQLLNLGDDAAIGEVKEVLSTVDGVADWLDDLPGSAAQTGFTDADMDADLIEAEDDLELDLGDEVGEDFNLDFDSESADEQPESEVTLDLDDANLDFEQAEETDEGFDLDLDSDTDFDLDFADLAESTDLGDLASEFGDTSEAKILPPETLETDSELSGDLDLDLGDDFDLSEEGESQGFTLPEATDTGFDESVAAGSEEFDFLSDTDEVATKLDLARAYIDMGDTEGAKDILDEVLQEGSDEQKQEADTLIERIE